MFWNFPLVNDFLPDTGKGEEPMQGGGGGARRGSVGPVKIELVQGPEFDIYVLVIRIR